MGPRNRTKVLFCFWRATRLFLLLLDRLDDVLGDHLAAAHDNRVLRRLAREPADELDVEPFAKADGTIGRRKKIAPAALCSGCEFAVEIETK